MHKNQRIRLTLTLDRKMIKKKKNHYTTRTLLHCVCTRLIYILYITQRIGCIILNNIIYYTVRVVSVVDKRTLHEILSQCCTWYVKFNAHCRKYERSDDDDDDDDCLDSDDNYCADLVREHCSLLCKCGF